GVPGSASRSVREQTVALLGSWGAEARECLPAVLPALADKDAEVRQAALRALTRYPIATAIVPPEDVPRITVPALVKALKDDALKVRVAATERCSLYCSAGAGLALTLAPALREALGSEDLELVLAAYRSLVAVDIHGSGPERDIEELITSEDIAMRRI